MIARFDHAVITVGARMDAAVETFRRLGFFVTPRGYHTLGSINHLVVFASTYIELLGLPADRPDARPELRDSPQGLDALVFRAEDAELSRAAAAARGAPVAAVQQFSRPVAMESGTRDAVFRTVRMPPGSAQAGRLYFCQHLTPELVWHPGWSAHPNGATDLAGATVRVRDADAEAGLYRSLLGETAVGPTASGFVASAAPVAIEIGATAGKPAMTGLSVRVADLDRAAKVLANAGIAFVRQPAAIEVPPELGWNVALRFVP